MLNPAFLVNCEHSEIYLGMYSLRGRVPHLVHHQMLRELALLRRLWMFSSAPPLSSKDAVDRGEFHVGERFIFNLSWTVGGVH